MEAENVVPRQVRLHKPTPPSAINCLPIEILAMIFTFVGVSKTPYNSPRNTTFPFNVASTCLFWMEILKSNPENWKSIYIDVVNPTPFLDAFTVFTGGPIEVFVFSSVKESAFRHSELHSVEDVQKCDENLQARIIHQKSNLSWNVAHPSHLTSYFSHPCPPPLVFLLGTFPSSGS